jgi:pantothenate kinase type III
MILASNKLKMFPDFTKVVDTGNASFACVNDTDNAYIGGVIYTGDALSEPWTVHL